jgi:hypothetical protein
LKLPGFCRGENSLKLCSSVPKRLRGMLADRPTALTKIFRDEIEQALITASGVTAAVATPSASRPRARCSAGPNARNRCCHRSDNWRSRAA